MTNQETRDHLLKWCEEEKKHSRGLWTCPTDACGYDQRIKFAQYRNKHWRGQCEFVKFVEQYAISLGNDENSVTSEKT